MNKSIFYLAAVAGAMVMLGRRAKNGGKGGVTDVTGTLPKGGPGPAPDADTAEQADREAGYVDIALENLPTVGPFLGQDGIDAGVPGMTQDGFVTPVGGEWLSGWMTRVSYWGAYPYNAGAPIMLPPTCILEVTCPEEYLPYRDALLRIAEMVNAGLSARGIKDIRYDAETGAFG